jgi:hypothetical protein
VKIPVIYISGAYISSKVETYQADAPGNSGRKRTEYIDSWAQPLCQSLVATVRFVKILDLILKDGKDCGSSVAGLQLRGKRMFEKVVLCLLSVGLQRSSEDGLEA